MLHKNQIKNNKRTKKTHIYLKVRELRHHGWNIERELRHHGWDSERTKQNEWKYRIETWGALWLEHDPKAILETRCSRFLWVSEAAITAVVVTVTVPMKTRKHRHSHRGGYWSTPICPKVLNALCIERSEENRKDLSILYENFRPLSKLIFVDGLNAGPCIYIIHFHVGLP